MTISIFTREGCVACSRFKKSLRQFGVPYKEVLIDKDISRDVVVEMYPGMKKLPIVVLEDGKAIDGPAAESMLVEYKENFGKELLLENE